jgi:hypothetical protein
MRTVFIGIVFIALAVNLSLCLFCDRPERLHVRIVESSVYAHEPTPKSRSLNEGGKRTVERRLATCGTEQPASLRSAVPADTVKTLTNWLYAGRIIQTAVQ